MSLICKTVRADRIAKFMLSSGLALLGGVSGLLLTTSNGVIYDGDGNVVKLRGIGWFGFNSA